MAHTPTGHFLDELRATFAGRSGETALAFRDETCTFGQLESKAERCAAWLIGHGAGPGERVVLATAEKRPFLAAHLGAIFAGAVALPANPKFTRDEMRHVLADSGARVAVVGREAGRWWSRSATSCPSSGPSSTTLTPGTRPKPVSCRPRCPPTTPA